MTDDFCPRIYAGDSLPHLKDMDDESVHVVAIDPPYNVGKAVWDKLGTRQAYRDWLLPYLTECARVLKESGTFWCFGVQPTMRIAQAILEDDLGLMFQNYVCCRAVQGGNNGHIMTRRHEDILVVSKGRPFFNRNATVMERELQNVRKYRGKTYNTKRISDNWDANPLLGKERIGHPTQKSLAVMRRIIRISAPSDGIILDCFGGSGSTSVAAIELERHSIYMERDPRYVGIAGRRFSAALSRMKLPGLFQGEG